MEKVVMSFLAFVVSLVALGSAIQVYKATHKAFYTSLFITFFLFLMTYATINTPFFSTIYGFVFLGLLINAVVRHFKKNNDGGSDMDKNLHRIFVYGTLMRGERNHGLIESQVLEGDGFIYNFKLYNLGSFPGIKTSDNPNHIVYGEVYLVDDRTLEQVNRLEGEGSLYILQSVEVQMDGKTVTAGVYVYNCDTKEKPIIHSGCWQQQSIYIAYGSNMNNHQMSVRCPSAKCLGNSELDGYKLLFRENKAGNIYATIEEDKSSSVPVVLWAIDQESEDKLDRFEGYHQFDPESSYYLKKTITLTFNNELVNGIVYVMINYGKTGKPSDEYFNRILTGYKEHGINPSPLISE